MLSEILKSIISTVCVCARARMAWLVFYIMKNGYNMTRRHAFKAKKPIKRAQSSPTRPPVRAVHPCAPSAVHFMNGRVGVATVTDTGAVVTALADRRRRVG